MKMKARHTPDLRNVLKMAIRGNVIFSDRDYEKMEEWVRIEKELDELLDGLTANGEGDTDSFVPLAKVSKVRK